MSCVQPRGGREGRSQTGGRLRLSCDFPINQKIQRPSGEGTERHIGSPEMPPETGTRRPGYGQQELPLSAPRDSSLGWQEERRLPPPRNSSPDWQEERRLPPRNFSPGLPKERPLADSDTLPARWRNAAGETRDTNQGQPRSNGAKVHFQEPDKRRQRTPEDDDQEGDSESSSGSSTEGSVVNADKDGINPDDGKLLSYCFDLIEHEGGGSGDEDEYVHVHHSSTRDRRH